LREWLESIAKYYTCALVVTFFVIMEWEGIAYSDLFVAVLTATLGILGITVYGKVKR